MIKWIQAIVWIAEPTQSNIKIRIPSNRNNNNESLKCLHFNRHLGLRLGWFLWLFPNPLLSFLNPSYKSWKNKVENVNHQVVETSSAFSASFSVRSHMLTCAKPHCLIWDCLFWVLNRILLNYPLNFKITLELNLLR